MGGKIRSKNRDPKVYEFQAEDIVINTKEGTIFFKSDNKLYKISGDDQTSQNINESLNTTVYDLNKLYHFYFYFENPYVANTVPIFGNSMITNDTIPTDGDQGNKAASYGEVICTPFAGKVVEINLAFEGDSDHTYWESDIIGPVSLSIYRHTGADNNQNIRSGFYELNNTQDNFLISSMNPGLLETVTKTNQYLRSNIQFKFGDNCTFEKGDMLLAKLEIDGVGSSFNDGDCIGHTFIKYDTSS